MNQESVSNGKSRVSFWTIAVIVALLIILVGTAVFTGLRTYRDRMEGEHFDELDAYSMHEFCRVNSEKAFSAVKAGDKNRLAELMMSTEGLEDLLSYADWSTLDIDNIVSFGSGSLSANADSNGRIDIDEKFIAETADGKYTFYIETLASRWGRKNEGISAISVTSYEHFDALEYDWCGEADEYSTCAGKLFWPGNQPAESQKP